MRIIILVRILWASGAQKIAINEARELTNMGHEVKIVFLRETESGRTLEKLLTGIDYEIFSDSGYRSKPIYSLVTGLFMPEKKGEGTLDYDLIRKFSGTVRKSDADYIICHDQWMGISGMRIKKREGIRYSVFLHEHTNGKYDVPIIGKFAEMVERNVLNNADSLFGVTEKVSASFRKAYGLRVITDFPGMDLSSNLDFDSKENVLISSGTWSATRYPGIYINVLNHLEGFRLNVVGRWEGRNGLEMFKKEINNAGLSDKVSVKVNVPEGDLSNLYATSKFSLRSGGADEMGLGTSNIEAISHLTPVLVDSVLGISDIISREGGGIVLDKFDPKRVAEEIINNNNSENYKKLQEELRNITQKYTWRRHAEKLIVA
ncbi:MAG: glycosyltransferase [Thermoplasmatales archaeon]